MINDNKRNLNGKDLTTKDGVQFEKDIANNKYGLIITKIDSIHSGLLKIKATNLVSFIEHNLNNEVYGY